MNIFYESHVQWFENVANGCIWAIIFAFAAFMVWLGYDLITGPRRQREEIKRMLSGLDTVQDISGVGLIRTHNGKEEKKSRPFGPGARKKQVKADLTAKS